MKTVSKCYCKHNEKHRHGAIRQMIHSQCEHKQGEKECKSGVQLPSLKLDLKLNAWECAKRLLIVRLVDGLRTANDWIEEQYQQGLDIPQLNLKFQSKSITSSNSLTLIESPRNAYVTPRKVFSQKGSLENTAREGQSPIPFCHLQIPQTESMQSDFLKLKSSGCSIPDHRLQTLDPAFSCDSFYVSQKCIGIADGVQEWKDFGVDPKLFGETLLKLTCDYICQENNQINNEEISSEALENSWWEDDKFGGATILYSFIKQSTLQIAYIGDVQAVVFRVFSQDQQKTLSQVFKSKPQAFGLKDSRKLTRFPNNEQLKQMTPKQRQTIKMMVSQNQQNPNKTSTQNLVKAQIPVLKDDIVLLGSDGLFDNLHLEEIQQIILNHLTEHENISTEELSKEICKQAWESSQSSSKLTPYAKESQKIRKNHEGGRADDITVVLAVVECDEEEEA